MIQEFLSKYGLIALLLVLPVVYAIQDLKDDGNLAGIANNLFAGLSNGAIIALIAVGYTLVYGIIELINFAHGEVFMIGSFTAAAFWGTIGLTLTSSPLVIILGLLLTLVVAMIVCGGLNVMIERVATGHCAARPSWRR